MSDAILLVFTVLPIGLTCGLIAGHVITVKRFRHVYDENKEKAKRIAELEAKCARLEAALTRIANHSNDVTGAPMMAVIAAEALQENKSDERT